MLLLAVQPVPHLSDSCSVLFFLIRGAFSARWKHPAVLAAEKLRRSLQTFHLGLSAGLAASRFKDLWLNGFAGKSPFHCLAIRLCPRMQKHF